MDQSYNEQKGSVTPRPPIINSLGQLLRQIGWSIVIGLAGSILLLIVFSELTEDIFRNEFTKIDDNFELWVHSLASPALDVFFNIFTTIGGVAGISVLTALTFGLLWRRGHLHSAWLVVLASGGGIVINQILKLLFRRPRPELWALTGHVPTSFSFPSGHSTAALCYFGVLGWLGWGFIKRPLLRLGWIGLMILFIGLVGLSRIYFGVHYPTDVIGGYLSGAFWLVILLEGAYILRRFRQKPS